MVRYLTDDLLRRSDHRSVQALENDIRSWVKAWNENPRPFIWTKPAEEILAKLGRLLTRINGRATLGTRLRGSVAADSRRVAARRLARGSKSFHSGEESRRRGFGGLIAFRGSLNLVLPAVSTVAVRRRAGPAIGLGSIEIVQREPYRLASDVWGIGFKTADTIAQAVGIPHDSPQRIKAGLQYTLSEAADNGHCYLPEGELCHKAAKILEVEHTLISPCLEELVAEEGVVRESLESNQPTTSTRVQAVSLVPFHRAERSLAAGLLELLHSDHERLPAFAEVNWDTALEWLRRQTAQELAPAQRQAVQLALTSKVAVLTGGPGCGKSFTIRSIVELATAKKATIVLIAPTGRAAKRLAELTDQEAFTVHRLLELQPGGEPRFDREHPLSADLLVIDECSMMDVILANKLIKAIPEGAHLLLVAQLSTNSPQSAPARSCATCSPPSASRGCA